MKTGVISISYFDEPLAEVGVPFVPADLLLDVPERLIDGFQLAGQHAEDFGRLEHSLAGYPQCCQLQACVTPPGRVGDPLALDAPGWWFDRCARRARARPRPTES